MRRETEEIPPTQTDPVASAKEAGLRYVTDQKAGIRRIKRGKKFAYLDQQGKRITEPDTLSRIRGLVIPPAWENVWISPLENGHLQATGRDARKRKQYRYHVKWREVRDETKFEKMAAFGRMLPSLRNRINRDLRKKGMPREKILATVVRLLETTLIRVGNEEYAKENHSFGLTTMRNRHVDIRADKVHFEFRGKSGIRHSIDIRDALLARIVRRCRDLPGQELFSYLDDEGNARSIDSSDVNAYLKEITGMECTAKDFRTWAGTVLAARALQEFEKYETQNEAKKNIVKAIEAVSRILGNTPAICRKCYVHPLVISSYLEGTLAETLRQRADQMTARALHKLKPEEAAVLMFIEQKLTTPKKRLPGKTR